ncbi:anti-sigma factor [Larkinella humicola]|uniref:Anti-sigma factor n=1 Tax=Larkinella humicola TaxID=2607654 RepID=A0A5N1JKQ8_9BACT|nr:anti-sigma factor [Larkinella humicola]KAA9357045.1 anti-sigma factor [Larkinella humicola]
MNTKEYIESGILEEYVLGTVSPQEKREVECLSSIYPEIRQELDTLSAAVEQYAQTLRRDPPTDIKEWLLKELEFGPPEVEVVEEVSPTLPLTSEESTETPIRSLNSREDAFDSRPTFRVTWLVAASLGLVVLFFAYFLYSQLQGSQQTLSSLRNSNEALTEEVRVLRAQQSQSDQTLAILKEPGTRVIRLNPTDSTTANLATIYWNVSTGQVNLEIDSLVRPPETQQYQLWAIVDGKPVDAGVFDVGDNTRVVQQAKKFLKADAFAITLERRGGSPTPTLSAMVVVGNVTS